MVKVGDTSAVPENQEMGCEQQEIEPSQTEKLRQMHDASQGNKKATERRVCPSTWGSRLTGRM